MTKKFLHKVFCLLGAFFLSLLFVFQTTILPAKAATGDIVSTKVQNFRKTSIIDDLYDIDIALYPKNPLGNLQVIRCQEYCYSTSALLKENYMLVIYVYNPTEQPINVDGRNTINMAVEYGENGKPSAWSKIELTYLDRMENYRFYKFEVGAGKNLLSLASNYADKHDGQRRYDFADIEFVSDDGKDIKSSSISKTYYFTGFSAGCGGSSSNESTLKCESEGAETIELKVDSTYYRTHEYDDNDTCDELNTAYFSVPQLYFEKYGNLQKIKAEWYEYKTNPIFVTWDNEAYNALLNYVGIPDEGSNLDGLDWGVYWGYTSKTLTTIIAERWFNSGKNNTSIELAGSTLGRMDYLLLCNKDNPRKSNQEILTYMDWYTSKFGGAHVTGYSSDLFSIDVDEGRKKGYNVEEIDAGEDRNLMVYDKKQSWWNKFWNGTKFENLGYSPILTFTSDDLSTVEALTPEQFGKTYLVNEYDQETVQSYVISELKKGNRPVLFRFAQTKYYASSAHFDKHDLFVSNEDGYVAQMTQFHDFDIISLTFRSDKGEDTVIGVCSTPIDIINGVDAPSDLVENMDWWEWFILLAVGLVLLFVLVILWPIIWPIIVSSARLIAKGLRWLICLPFVLIGKLFKRKDKPHRDDKE